MSAPQFTPGPWFAADGGVVWHEAVIGASHPECCGDFKPNGECCGLSVQGYHEELAQEQVAQCSPEDADLIAAAPELYEAAVKHLEWIDKEHGGPDYSGLTRDTHPDGERIWRKWWDEQLDLCADTERLCRVALAKVRGETA